MSNQNWRRIAEHEGPAVTIALQTARTGTAKAHGPKKLKKLLNQLPEEAAPIVQAIETHAEDNDLWRHTQEGLVIHATEDRVEVTRVTYPPTESAYYSDHLSLLPLVPQLLHSEHFIVLSLFQDCVRAVEVRGTEIEALELPGVALNIDDALPEDAGRERQLQHSPQRAGTSRHNGGTGSFHGHGGSDSFEKHVESFIRETAREVDLLLYRRHRGVPVFLNTSPNYISIARQELHRTQVFQSVDTGNHNHLKESALVELMRPMIAEEFEKNRMEATEFHKSKADNGLYLTNPGEIKNAVMEGRCKELIIGNTDFEPGGELDELVRFAVLASSEVLYLPEIEYYWVASERF